MKNQLFRIIPDKKITLKLLSFFGIHNFEDNHSFTKDFLIEFNTLDKLNNIIKELENYYIPCKYKIYLRNLNEKKCITILRQFIKIHDYTLFSKEKYKNGKKLLFYQVIRKQIDLQNIKKSNDKIILSFD
tara:strand:+ start:257 stop:646 length:390 start_codon:yes stop_codon:yes gene_type:complete